MDVTKSADDVIERVKADNPQLCELRKCVEFASAAALKKKGISGVYVRVSNGGAVDFDGKSI